MSYGREYGPRDPWGAALRRAWARRLRRDGVPVRWIARRLGVGEWAVYSYLRADREPAGDYRRALAAAAAARVGGDAR